MIIQGVEILERHKLHIQDLAIIRSLNVDMETNIMEWVALFQRHQNAWPDFTLSFTKLLLRFEGIRALAINNYQENIFQVMGFDIIDQSNFGQRIYKVEDYEDGKISFYCDEIIVEDLNENVWL